MLFRSGECRRTGQEVLERLFLYGVYAKPTGATVGGEDNLLVFTGAHETKALLPITQLAGAWTEIALDTTIAEAMPVLGRKGGGTHSYLSIQ